MKRKNFGIKILAVLSVFVLLTAPAASLNASAADSTSQSDEYAGMTAEEKQAALEQKLKEVNKKLDSIKQQSKDTREYLDTLDEKISYMQEQLKISESEIDESSKKIKSLERQYEDNETEIAQLTAAVSELEAKNAQLEQSFSDNLQLCYKRLRAFYVSGETSTIAMLLTCDDISSLLTRFEMIKRVSQADSDLLESVEAQAAEISSTKTRLQEKKDSLSNNQKTLVSTQKMLANSITTLEQQQKSYNEKQATYESEKSESDELLKKLDDEKQTYSEYRNQDQAELEAVNAEIAAAAEAFKKKMEAQTSTTKKPSSTKKKTTSQSTEQSTETTAATDTTQSESSDKLKMTYPVPSQTKITCGYGSAGYAGHTGIDFSCSSGSSVVAAESGYVIISADLTNSDGTYRSYGRYIVIMHDKTDSAGNYVYTLYAHNSQRLVTAGQYVSKGQEIAKSGSTGNSTGPHCHFEVRTPTADYSSCVNPTYYLQ